MSILKIFFPASLFGRSSILSVGLASLLFYLQVIPLPVLLAAMAFGLFSLVKTAGHDLTKKEKLVQKSL